MRALTLNDPRHYQIVFLGGLLCVGLWSSFLDIDWLQSLAFIGSALLIQGVLDVMSKRAWNWKSALITSLSLSLLLRTPSLSMAACASGVAIASKFLFTFKGQHVFNPANFAIVICALFLDAWISPGQWGHNAWLSLLFIGLGFLVSMRATRVDVALIFLLSFILLLALRSAYLGDPFELMLHQLNNGALLLFAFFMITDPRTSPNHWLARIIYAVALAVIGFVLQYYFFVSQGMLFALVLVCLCVPLLNTLFVERSYKWGI
ncbi:MAG: RnfABCDGE type electron transport complex subunit D [Pseudomonadota bacterium]